VCQFRIALALLAVIGCRALQALGIATLFYPLVAYIVQPLQQVDLYVRIGVRAGSIIDRYRRIGLGTEAGGGIFQMDLTHRYSNIRARALDIDLLRTIERLGGI